MPNRSTEFSRTCQRITRWKEVAELLRFGWRVEGFDLVSPEGQRRSAWGNAIEACRKRGLISSSSNTSSAEHTK
jgi:hypothetical protein